MNTRVIKYSSLIRQSSNHAHHFIKKLRFKDNDTLHFLLVDDTKRNKQTNSTSYNKQTVPLQKPLKRLEKRVPQFKLNANTNKSVHLLSQNAKGYAIFMGINRGGTKDREIKEIKAQFIDVDLNKISVHLSTKAEVKQKIKAIRSTPSEQIQSITVQKNKQNQYKLIALRTEPRIAQLKKEFLKKHWDHIKSAMIIETNSGFHIYWIMQGASVSKFVPIQKALVQKFDSDPMITNLSRVMRLPGFYHMKNPSKPFLVRVIHWGRKKPFSQEELINTLHLKPIHRS
jgi:hypothetical protein